MCDTHPSSLCSVLIDLNIFVDFFSSDYLLTYLFIDLFINM